jgi:hypothetical protein
MESKYKERAEEILKMNICIDVIGEDTSTYAYTIKAMCQLAEEVEKVYRDPLMFGEEGSIQKVYSKAYVEELLQKQRELCLETVKSDAMKLYDSDVPDCWDGDSILNAKLKIDGC